MSPCPCQQRWTNPKRALNAWEGDLERGACKGSDKRRDWKKESKAKSFHVPTWTRRDFFQPETPTAALSSRLRWVEPHWSKTSLRCHSLSQPVTLMCVLPVMCVSAVSVRVRVRERDRKRERGRKREKERRRNRRRRYAQRNSAVLSAARRVFMMLHADESKSSTWIFAWAKPQQENIKHGVTERKHSRRANHFQNIRIISAALHLTVDMTVWKVLLYVFLLQPCKPVKENCLFFILLS